MKKFLIVGLGNPGIDYEFTRHNVGFKALDYFAESQSISFEAARFGKLAQTSVKGRKIFLLKPDTYMNLSGKAVAFWQKQENIPLENILVITDDLNLDFGVLRLKAKGSAGGHNGLQNIQDILQTQAYPRLRVGIGNRFSKGRQVDYVLGKWDEDELKHLGQIFDAINQLLIAYVLQGIQPTMNAFNKNWLADETP